MIKNYIWDFDGTLFDTYPAITQAFQKTIKSLGYNVSLSIIDALVKVNLDYCIDQIVEWLNVDRDMLIEIFQREYKACPPDVFPPFSGVIDTCKTIKAKGGKNFIATHRRKSGTLALLNYYEMENLFTEIICGDNGFPHKPDPAMFLYLMKQHQLSKDETITIGDRALDIAAGRSAGIQTVLFIALDDTKLKADRLITDFHDLL